MCGSVYCTLAIHLTLLIFCSIINPQCPRALLQVSYLQFHGITYPLVLVLFVSALKIWNSLTPQIRQCQTLATFRRHLKTHYFQSAFSAT